MANLDASEKKAKKSLYDMGYEYLCNNFHKFSQANKIRVSISILQIFNRDDSRATPGSNVVQIFQTIKQESGQDPVEMVYGSQNGNSDRQPT